MSPYPDVESNHSGQPRAEPSDAPPSSPGQATMPQNAQSDGNNFTQQSGGTPYRRNQSSTTNRNATQPQELAMPAGHPRLAELMGLRPQMGIFRRFGYLNAQNLLYMQAELVGLEKKLKALQTEDARRDSGLRLAGDWKALRDATPPDTDVPGSHDNGENSSPRGTSVHEHKMCEEWGCVERRPHKHCAQWDLAMLIREKLQRYNEALIQQRTLAYEAPDSYDLEWIQRCLDSRDFGMKDALQGDDKLLWGSSNGDLGETGHVNELITWVPLSKRDPFNELIFKKLAKRILDPESLWHKVLKNRSLEDKTLLRWTTAATSAVTATVPIVSVVVLYFTPNTNVRLGLLAVFNLLAAFVLYIFTEAQPMQVFAASAAYSAVNIVFIGSNATSST